MFINGVIFNIIMFKAKIIRVGGSLAIIIPDTEAKFNNYKEEDWLEIDLKKLKKVDK